MGAVSEYTGADVYVLWAEGTLDDGVRGEVSKGGEDYGGSEREYGDESSGEAPKLEGTGPGTDPVQAIGPESSRGKS